MTKVDDILNKLNLEPFFSYYQQQEAKAQLLELVLEVVGEDEAESKQNYGKDYYTQVRNAQRAEQRQKAIKLFGGEDGPR